MKSMRKWLFRYFATQLLLLFFSSPALAVIAEGMGSDRDQALNSALQAAIEAELGVMVESNAVNKNFMLIKKEIVTHSKGYVTDYRIKKQNTTPDGIVTITIDASVDSKLLTDHTRTMEILMKMAGHPKLLIFGIDEDFNAVPAGTEYFDALIKAVSRVFREKFKFDVLDWPTLQAHYPDIEGQLNRNRAVQYNDRFKADIMITVGLNLLKESQSRGRRKARLTLSGIRISDNHLLGEVFRTIGPFSSAKAGEVGTQKAAIAATEKEDIFLGAVDLAGKIATAMQKELDRGHGFKYSVSFLDFPDIEELEAEMPLMDGYVRHILESKTKSKLTLAYWSNLKTDALMQRIKKMLDQKTHTYRFKIDGRMIMFKWKHPEDF